MRIVGWSASWARQTEQPAGAAVDDRTYSRRHVERERLATGPAPSVDRVGPIVEHDLLELVGPARRRGRDGRRAVTNVEQEVDLGRHARRRAAREGRWVRAHQRFARVHGKGSDRRDGTGACTRTRSCRQRHARTVPRRPGQGRLSRRRRAGGAGRSRGRLPAATAGRRPSRVRAAGADCRRHRSLERRPAAAGRRPCWLTVRWKVGRGWVGVRGRRGRLGGRASAWLLLAGGLGGRDRWPAERTQRPLQPSDDHLALPLPTRRPLSLPSLCSSLSVSYTDLSSSSSPAMAPPPSKKAAPAAAGAGPAAPAGAKAEKKDLVPKPDQQQFKSEQDAVRAEIDALQAQLVRLFPSCETGRRG
jgi:hypothetical protein